jgi:hypothetical protein
VYEEPISYRAFERGDVPLGGIGPAVHRPDVTLASTPRRPRSRAIAQARDPDFAILSPVAITAIGRKPAR